jgi:hypothetical protein
LLIAAAIVTVTGFFIDTPPFTPGMSPPDYKVVMAEKSAGKEVASRVVTHHGQWTRTDRAPIDLSGRNSLTSQYYSASSGASLIVSDERSITIRRNFDWPVGVDHEARNSGERRDFLGESCTIWNVWRTKHAMEGTSSSQLACVTDDGIALWERTLRGDEIVFSIEASQIERRPVSAMEIQFPRALLTLAWWDTDLPPLDATSVPDHEAVMALADAPATETANLTTRRLGPWRFTELILGSLRRITIAHDSQRMRFEYASTPSGDPNWLSIVRPGPAPYSSLPTLSSAATTDPKHSEVLLGETCRWSGPVGATARPSACLTHDGIALKRTMRGYGITLQTWIAVRMTRRPIKLDEIKPPAELLDPAFWGLD